mmetsp:Transcript_34238/g.110367  ORF Transcript_34238/g.110367 Transcript_34238/m.110367 type:complete len:165 (-) Transcript_34238:30-524(-)
MDSDAVREAVLRGLRQSGNATEGSFADDVRGFVHAVDWTEPWLKGLLGLHLSVWAVVIVTRRVNELQMALLVAILGAVYGAERLNALGAAHWREFATQDYFDERGVFVALLYCTPLLLAAGFILLNALRTTARLLVEVKRRELRANAKARAKGGGGEGGSKKKD